MIQHEDTTEVHINELLKVPQQNPEQETYWFPTPDEPGDPATDTPIQQRIYQELLELQELEKLNPNDNDTSGKHFFQTSTGLIQHSAQTNDKKLRKFSSNFTISLQDIVWISEKTANSK